MAPSAAKPACGRTCECGYRIPKSGDTAPTGAWQTPEWMLGPKPCTAEENAYAASLVRAVLDLEITPEQAQAVLHEIFQGREKEL